jgi:hypothetical protein
MMTYITQSIPRRTWAAIFVATATGVDDMSIDKSRSAAQWSLKRNLK